MALVEAFKPLGVRLPVLMIVVLAWDFLIYQQVLPGINVAIALAILAVAAFYLAGRAATAKTRIYALLLLALGIIPVILQLNFLTWMIALLFCFSSVVIYQGLVSYKRVGQVLEAVTARLLQIFYLLPKDLDTWNRFRRKSGRNLVTTTLIKWVLPILLASVFLILFMIANPLIDKWLSQLISNFKGPTIDTWTRLLFWSLASMFVWPFLRMKSASVIRHLQLDRSRTGDLSKQTEKLSTNPDGIVEEEKQVDKTGWAFRSLLLFNLLFAIQTMLDIYYLWGDAQLPYGFTYAQYVHRGTTALFFATLLATVFILIFAAPQADYLKRKSIFRLLIMWIMQNFILVVSTSRKLQLYIQAYDLTYQRIAVLAMALLILIGLVLIAVRIHKRRSNNWLINANLGALISVGFLASLINWSGLIAGYNVNSAVDNPGRRLDLAYLCDLGPAAIPSMDEAYYILKDIAPKRLLGFICTDSSGRIFRYPDFIYCRNRMANKSKPSRLDWRQWTYRKWDIANYVSTSKPLSMKIDHCLGCQWR